MLKSTTRLSEVAAAQAPGRQGDDGGGPGDGPEDEDGGGGMGATERAEADDDAGDAGDVAGDLVERGLVHGLEGQRGRYPLAALAHARDLDAGAELLEQSADQAEAEEHEGRNAGGDPVQAHAEGDGDGGDAGGAERE